MVRVDDARRDQGIMHTAAESSPQGEYDRLERTPLRSSSSLSKMAMESAISSELLRGTVIPPTGIHSEVFAPTVRIHTIYSGAPDAFMASKSLEALDRFAVAATFFGAGGGAGGCLPKPFPAMHTPICARWLARAAAAGS